MEEEKEEREREGEWGKNIERDANYYEKLFLFILHFH